MEGLRRRWRWMRRDGGQRAAETTDSWPTTSAFVHRLSDTMHSTAMPLKRLLDRVKVRFSASTREENLSLTSTLRATFGPSSTPRAQLESLRFCIWRGTCGWTLQRRYLHDEGCFAWVVSHVTTISAWEDDGIRPGDVLESINGESLAFVTREKEIRTRLKAAVKGTALRFRVRSRFEQCRLQRFFVVVEDQPIGASIIADGLDSVPVVIHVAPPRHCTTPPQIRLGDVLTEVNGENVVGWDMPAIMALVEASRPHMTVTFQRLIHTDCGPRCRDGIRMMSATKRPSTNLLLSRRSSTTSTCRRRLSGDEFHDFGEDDDGLECEPTAVVLVWRAGPLGLTVIKDDDAQMPCVNRLTGKGTVCGIHRLRRGYHLASINGHPTHERPFRDVLHDLQNSKKPLWLVFLAPNVRASMYSTTSRDTSDKISSRARWSSSSSLLSLDESWDMRSTNRFTSTVATTFESEDE